MIDNQTKTIRYVTGDMEDWEEAAFEAEMAANADLRLHVQLEQVRMNNIRCQVAAVPEFTATAPIPETAHEPPPRGLRRVFRTLTTRGLRQWLTIAAVSAGLAVGAIELFQPGAEHPSIEAFSPITQGSDLWDKLAGRFGFRENARPGNLVNSADLKEKLLQSERLAPGNIRADRKEDVKEMFRLLPNPSKAG